MEKSYYVIVEETKVMQTYGLAYKNMSAQQLSIFIFNNGVLCQEWHYWHQTPLVLSFNLQNKEWDFAALTA